MTRERTKELLPVIQAFAEGVGLFGTMMNLENRYLK